MVAGGASVSLPWALAKLVITCGSDSWYGLAGLTPVETRSLPLVSSEYITGSVAAENTSSRLSHAEEQGNRAVQWSVTIMKAGKSKTLTVHLRRLTPHLTGAVRQQLPAAPAACASCPQHLVIEMSAVP